jgi:hypothetical protein
VFWCIFSLPKLWWLTSTMPFFFKWIKSIIIIPPSPFTPSEGSWNRPQCPLSSGDSAWGPPKKNINTPLGKNSPEYGQNAQPHTEKGFFATKDPRKVCSTNPRLDRTDRDYLSAPRRWGKRSVTRMLSCTSPNSCKIRIFLQDCFRGRQRFPVYRCRVRNTVHGCGWRGWCFDCLPNPERGWKN